MVTRGVMCGKPYKRDASAGDYIPLIVTLIKRRKGANMKMPHTLAFTGRVKDDGIFANNFAVASMSRCS